MTPNNVVKSIDEVIKHLGIFSLGNIHKVGPSTIDILDLCCLDDFAWLRDRLYYQDHISPLAHVICCFSNRCVSSCDIINDKQEHFGSILLELFDSNKTLVPVVDLWVIIGDLIPFQKWDCYILPPRGWITRSAKEDVTRLHLGPLCVTGSHGSGVMSKRIIMLNHFFKYLRS